MRSRFLGGRDDPHIHLDRFARADRFDFAFLNGAQKLHLGRRRQFADFVEKQRAAGGFDEFAVVALGGAGERAFSWPNRHRLDQVFRHGAAIDRDERAWPSRSPEPWMARATNSLPTPDSPAISTGMVDAAAFSAMRSTPCMRRAFGDDVGEAERAGAALPDAVELALEGVLVLSALRKLTCRRSAPTGLTTKSMAPARMAKTTVLDAAVRGLHHHGTADPRLDEFSRARQARRVRDHEIEDHAIDPAPSAAH